MRLGLISDIHGDPLALELTLRHFQALKVDRVLSAGDLVGHGTFPDRVAAIFRERGIASARGNHDRWAITAGPGGPLPFGGAPCASETIEVLERFPQTLPVAGHDRVGLIAHATPESDMIGITPDEWKTDQIESLLEELSVDFLIAGHTHRPGWHKSAAGLFVNPGSLTTIPGIPSSRTFAVLELPSLTVTFHDVETGNRREVDAWR